MKDEFKLFRNLSNPYFINLAHAPARTGMQLLNSNTIVSMSPKNFLPCRHKSSVVDRHRFDADPDQTFHFAADPDPDPTPSFTHIIKSEYIFFYFNSQQYQFTLFHLTRQCHGCHPFQYFGDYV